MSYRSSRHFISMLLWLCLSVMTAHAGTLAQDFVTQDNSLTTTLDDVNVVKNLHWYDGANVQFFYIDNVSDGSALITTPLIQDPGFSDPGSVIQAADNALATWNKATWGKFKFASSVMPASMAPNPYGMFNGVTGIGRAEVDGVNTIDFSANSLPDTTQIAETWITYVERDFDMNSYFINQGIDLQFLDPLLSPSGNTARTVLVNIDGNFNMILPYQNFKAGEIVDVDILFNSASTPDFRFLPDDPKDVQNPALTPGALDIQALLTHELGWARGLGNTLISDATMYAKWNMIGSYPTNPYHRRKLAFDDQMTVAMADGTDLLKEGLGGISGSVLNGATLGAASNATTGGGTSGSNTLSSDLFVIQAPVFVALPKAQVPDVPLFAKDFDASTNHPDDVVARASIQSPVTYRLLAQVQTGQSLTLAAGSGTPITGGTTGNTGTGTTGTGETVDAGTFDSTTNLNGNYLFPGLPPTDKSGVSLNYGVYLPATLHTTAIASFILNPVQRFMNASFPNTYPTEWYGGPNATVPFGNGTATVLSDPNDDFFMNNYIAAEFNGDGRFAASINAGPEILSGFNNNPRSYVVVQSGNKSFTNQFGPIGAPVPGQEARIQDTAGAAEGAWQQNGQFTLTTNMSLTDRGGIIGIPSGLLVTHTLRNLADSTQTLSVRQVIDASLMGRENPVYVVNDQVIDHSITLTGAQIPTEMTYQTSRVDPFLRGFITMSQPGTPLPDKVTIGRLSEMGKTITTNGAPLRAGDSESIDSGVALTWGAFTLQPNEVRVVSFIIGFMPPGSLRDTWVPFPTDANAALTGLEDDPDQVTPVPVTAGQIHDGIDIVTNTGAAPAVAGTSVPDGSAAGPLQFQLEPSGFPDTKMITTGGAMADIDGDGDLDIVTSVMPGENSDGTNRVYLNEQRINNDGSVTYYYRDVTFGEDGIPNTADDRMTPLYPGDVSMGVVVADFDGDGYPDIFITNRGTPNRFYQNVGATHPGFFVERTNEVLPHLLNTDQYDGSEAHMFGPADIPYRAVAGDIDGDGDLDLIITQFYPFTDSNRSVAWVDASPRSDAFPDGDSYADATGDLFTQTLLYTERVLINQINIPPYAENWALRQSTLPGNGQTAKRGFYFIDETLGTDDEAGTMTSLELAVTTNLWHRQLLSKWDPSELDRVPPVFPAMYHLGGMASETEAPQQSTVAVVPSPMNPIGVEPRLGPFFGDAGLDLLSVRSGGILEYTEGLDTVYSGSYPGGGATDPPNIIRGDAYYSVKANYGTEQAYFRNMDIFNNNTGELGADGIPDGYFACMNYNMDYGAEIGQDLLNPDQIPQDDPPAIGTGPGLFVYQIAQNAGKPPSFYYDAFPLFIGMPQGHPADYTPKTNFEGDLVPPISRNAWAGVIGDWDYSGAPKPFIAAANGSADSSMFTFGTVTHEGVLAGNGVNRGEYDSLYGGRANQYLFPYQYAYQYNMHTGEVIEWPEIDVDKPAASTYPNGLAQAGEPYGVAAGDFNHDGRLDLFLVNSSERGIVTWNGSNGGWTFIWGPPAPKQVFLNNGFSHFTETNALVPNNPTNSMYCLVGDVNNDGALDLISLNAFSANELFINQIYKQPPNLTDPKDATMFYEASVNFLPPVMETAAAPGFTDITGAYSSVTNHSTVADLNGDGRPDLLLAEGSTLSLWGDFSRILFNTGEPKNDAVPVFKPAGAPNPAPRVCSWGQDWWLGNGGAAPPLFGYVGSQGYTSDITTADVDGDGDPDVIVVHDGSGPQLLVNEDSDNKLLNSVPDQDHRGDGILLEHDGWMPTLLDPVNPGDPQPPVPRKWRSRRIRVADFDHDGRPDLVIGNGIPGSAAENVLLMNSPTQPGHFIDVTEKNLPTVTTNGIKHGVYDDTYDVAVGDFRGTGNIDIIFANAGKAGIWPGFRMLLNDGTGHFIETAPGSHLPEYVDRKPMSIVVADFDGLGEPTEDKNHNGILDPGEDTNGNGVIDWVDLPNENFDTNGDGVVEPNEGVDLNGDGIITKRTDGKYDGSLDLFVSFDQGPPTILINDPTNQHPGFFTDESMLRFSEGLAPGPNRGAVAGDIDNDGNMDIVVAQYIGGLVRPIKIWKNNIKMVDGHARRGYFTDISYEVPIPRGVGMYSEFYDSTGASHEVVGATTQSFTGWANDVSLLDVDGDGDLDIYVATQGTSYQTLTQGSYDIFYVNRLIGANWNARKNGGTAIPVGPTIYGIDPAGAAPDTKALPVTLTGENFQKINAACTGEGFDPTHVLNFGKGITVKCLTPKSANVLSATIDVAADAVPGPRALTIQNPDGSRASSTKMGFFNVVAQGTTPHAEVPNRVWSLYQ